MWILYQYNSLPQWESHLPRVPRKTVLVWGTGLGMIPDIRLGCSSTECPSECVVCESRLPCIHCEQDECEHFCAYVEEAEE
jgi:hypothetical protein